MRVTAFPPLNLADIQWNLQEDGQLLEKWNTGNMSRAHVNIQIIKIINFLQFNYLFFT